MRSGNLPRGGGAERDLDHCPQYVNYEGPRNLCSVDLESFLGKEMCICFPIYSAVMLWVDFLELATKKMMRRTMRQRSVDMDGKPLIECVEAYAALEQAHRGHKRAPCFEGLKSKWAGQTKLK